MRKLHFLFAILLISFTVATAQRNCGSMDVLQKQLLENPSMLRNMEEIEKQVNDYIRNHSNGGGRAVITIPTVFHIVYNSSVPAQNISDAQVQSQMTVLNNDFRALNSDAGLLAGTVFAGMAADCEINFCLATQDPNGVATTGITRKSSTVTSWGTNDNVKKSSAGGVDPWNRNNYLNIWVCNIGGGILGYAQFPGGSAATDGVVCDYRYTGTIGTATAPFDKGRTATHEVGHWLNLRHIWGDATCGNDLVSDTPVHNTSNGGCPSYPHLSTCTGTPIEMTMNYMDYTNDVCMYMFSPGQKTRIRAIVDAGGARATLASSPGCNASGGGGGGGTCAAPTSLGVSSVTTSTISMTWLAVTGATSYVLEYKLPTASTWSIINTTITAAIASGLQSNTTYNFRVKTICGNTASTYSNTVNVATAATGGGGGGGGGCADVYESNNSRTAAKTIALNTNISAVISSTSDKDWFKFNNTSTMKNVKVDLTNLPADYDMRLYRSTTQVAISELDGTTPELCIYNTTSTATTYYVQVYGFNGAFNASSCYNLFATISGSQFRTENGQDIVELETVTNDFAIFPNPASDEITILLPFGGDSEGNLYISDIMGKVILNQNIQGAKGQNQIMIDVGSINNGLYLVTFKTGDDVYTQKLVIAKN